MGIFSRLVWNDHRTSTWSSPTGSSVVSTAGTLITPDWPLLVQVTAQLAMAATV